MQTAGMEKTSGVADQAPIRPVRGLPVANVRAGALLALVVAAIFVGWLVLRDGDENRPSAGPSAASAEELRQSAGTAGHPVYWAGQREGHVYEVTKTTDGRFYVRYLPSGVQVGDPRPGFLTVGTYPRPRAFAELRRAARARGAVSVKLPRGGLMVFSNAKPTSVYFGYPG